MSIIGKARRYDLPDCRYFVVGYRLGPSKRAPDHIDGAHLEKWYGRRSDSRPLVGSPWKAVKKTDGCRLIVAINLIGQGAAVHIDADDIAPLHGSVNCPVLTRVC